MAESLESFKSYIGKSETATDVVTASAMLKFAATLGQENPPLDKGAPIPPGWYGAFFPASHRPSQMRLDGQASGGGIVPPIPLPRRRIGGTRVAFHEPLRIGDEIKRVTEIADIQIDDGPSGAMATITERNSISNSRGLAVVEERDMVMLSEQRAEGATRTPPAVPAEATWRQVFEPNPPLLFRFSAIRFNSHRIHYDRDYVTKVEGYPGLIFHGPMQAAFLVEFAAKLHRGMAPKKFSYRGVQPLFEGSEFSINANETSAGMELWTANSAGQPTMKGTATW